MISNNGSSAAQLRLDERNHVDKPFLNQFHGLDWECIYNQKESSDS